MVPLLFIVVVKRVLEYYFLFLDISYKIKYYKLEHENIINLVRKAGHNGYDWFNYIGNVKKRIYECLWYSKTSWIPQYIQMGKNKHPSIYKKALQLEEKGFIKGDIVKEASCIIQI